MGDKTGIAWTTSTWNVFRGCTVVSPGCTNCYAMKQAARWSGRGQPYEGLTMASNAGPVWTGGIRYVDHMLDQPLRWSRPRRIFVNSMSDLWHDGISDEEIDRVWAVMALAGWHTFQVLTKRADRMLSYLGDPQRRIRVMAAIKDLIVSGKQWPSLRGRGAPLQEWPLPNVHILVSVEDQKRADERIPALLATPAAVRGISAEPLLERLDLVPYLWPDPRAHGDARRLDWVIVGGESASAHRVRPFDIGWARFLRDQCREAAVPLFIKQLGSAPINGGERYETDHPKGERPEEWPVDMRVQQFPPGFSLEPVGVTNR